MEIAGRIKNGVVVFEGETTLPDGKRVTVLLPGVRIYRKKAAPAKLLPKDWKIDGALIWGRRGRQQ